MRTPAILIIGLVLSPCGWILDLVSTVAPSWRQLSSLSGQSSDATITQGIWDICLYHSTTNQLTCNMASQDQPYFQSNQIIQVAQGMMIASLIVTAIGLAVVAPGARCWTNKRPRWVIAGLGGLLIFCSGVLVIIPIAWYTNKLTVLNTSYTFTTQPPPITVGYCIVLGYIGGIMEVIAGLVICIGFCRCCGGRNRGEDLEPEPVLAPQRTSRAPNPVPYPRHAAPYARQAAPYPRQADPRSVTRASSSVPYSRDSLDEDIDYPRAKHQRKGQVNPSYAGRPYDADL